MGRTIASSSKHLKYVLRSTGILEGMTIVWTGGRNGLEGARWEEID